MIYTALWTFDDSIVAVYTSPPEIPRPGEGNWGAAAGHHGPDTSPLISIPVLLLVIFWE